MTNDPNKWVRVMLQSGGYTSLDSTNPGFQDFMKSMKYVVTSDGFYVPETYVEQHGPPRVDVAPCGVRPHTQGPYRLDACHTQPEKRCGGV
jgi:hypothetical protein